MLMNITDKYIIHFHLILKYILRRFEQLLASNLFEVSQIILLYSYMSYLSLSLFLSHSPPPLCHYLFQFHFVNKGVAPKRARLLEAESELKVVMAQLAVAMATLKEVKTHTKSNYASNYALSLLFAVLLLLFYKIFVRQ